MVCRLTGALCGKALCKACHWGSQGGDPMLGSCWTGLSSEPSSCYLREVSCVSLQKVPASLVDCLSIQLLFPASCRQSCTWPCGLRVWERGIVYRLGKTVGRALLLWAYGEAIIHSRQRLSGTSAWEDPPTCFVISPMDSFIPYEKLWWT